MAKDFKLNKTDLKKLENQINLAIEGSMSDTYKYYKGETPIRSGNARNKTKYTKSSDKYKINSNYDYAGRLDSGWSRQSPKGMTDPSLNYLEKELAQRFRKI